MTVSGDENGATHEVEVTKPDGSTVDVRLDDEFNERRLQLAVLSSAAHLRGAMMGG